MKDGFFITALRMGFFIAATLIAWKAATGFWEAREAQRRRVAIELFLRENLPADRYADYVLIRDGIVKPSKP